jgi:ribonucleoside-diphosphate reductase alpha subunit
MVLLANNNIINKMFLDYIIANKDTFNNMISYDYDYTYDYFGFKTLEKSYLLKINGKIIERPQDMLLRVAITLQMGNIKSIEDTYKMMKCGYYTHASPTLYNAGTNHMQLASCFLMGTSDSLTSITHTWDSCAQISKWAGGIGLHVSNIRAKDSLICGTNGRSNGLVPFLKVFNDIARWIDQGGRRPGSIAIYLETYHADIFEFLDLRKNFGSETERARDLFMALWVSDLFMKQVEKDGDWYLMSPDESIGLSDTYGDMHEELYWSYVNMNKYRSKIKARKLWTAILEAQIETGMPYITFKDHVNKKSNQMNIGIIRSSNLCNEIVQYSDDKEYAVCNLASIALKPFVKPYVFNQFDDYIVYTKPNCKYCDYAKLYLSNNNVKFKEIPYNNDTINELTELLGKDEFTYPQIIHKTMIPGELKDILNNKKFIIIGGWNELYKYTAGTFNYDSLYETAYTATINLNQVIDINYYPVPETKISNMRHRPIGLGIQALADALVLLRIPFESDEAVEFNAKIMETIYLAAIKASNDMAKERYMGMIELITLGFDFPEYYDMNFIINDNNINNLYHRLKPCKYELIKDNDSLTIGAYSTFNGSPFSKGMFQFDMWNLDHNNLHYKEKWDILKNNVIKYGVRNSMLTALMPTASTSQILGNNECFEFFTSNIYSRKTQAGSFTMVNKYLVNDLISLNMWNKEMKDTIIAMNGSIQNIMSIPAELKTLYKTMWEIKQVWVLKAAAARGPFVDQTQSMNIFMAEPDYTRLNSSHFWGWKNGLKTGMYYLRTKPATDAIKFTIDPKLVKEADNCTNSSA